MLRPFIVSAAGLWLMTASATLAQKAPADETPAPKPAPTSALRPLTAREGLAIVHTIDDRDDEDAGKPDCSHLVHELYSQAGFSYEYAGSLDLYNGNENFVRVRAPRPGDLIVWRGHVGLVVDPKEHSFYSSVRSGLKTEFYDSAYWQARGRPRFYRYLTENPVRVGSRGVREASSRRPLPEATAATDRQEEVRPASERAKVNAEKPGPARREDAASAANAAAAGTAPEPEDPAGLLRVSGSGAKPVAADVTATLTRVNTAAGDIFSTGDLAQLGQPVVVYRELRVTGVEVKGKRGSARVEIERVATLTRDRMKSERGGKKLRLELNRTEDGWVITPLKESTYVPQDAAVRILAARLAALTSDPDRSAETKNEQAQIVRFLSLLVLEN